jgi:hypothetical protein
MSRRSSNATSRSPRRDRGVALAALLCAITVMFIGMGVAASGYSYIKQDDDEQELLFNGMQIVKALERARLKNNAPATLKGLVGTKDLRKEYPDPIGGKWRLIHEGQPLDVVGCGGPGVVGQPAPSVQERLSAPSGFLAYLRSSPVLATVRASDRSDDRVAQGPGTPPHGRDRHDTSSGIGGDLGETTGGPIIGVRSRAKGWGAQELNSLRLFWLKNHYDEWCFIAEAGSQQATVPKNVFTIQQMVAPKPGPMPAFDPVPAPRHPWVSPQR